MKISPVNFSSVNKLVNKLNLKAYPVAFRASCDTFEKTQDNIFSPENLKEIFSNPENEIGHGAYNRVFVIPNNDEYVLRIPKQLFCPENITQAEFQKIDTNLPDNINIGQAIGNIKVDGGPYGSSQIIEVLKKQKGKSYGVPHISAITDEYGKLYPNEVPYGDISRKESYRTLISKVSKMDENAFVHLLETFKTAQEHGYGFDPFNVQNLLLDDNEINMIDFNKTKVKCSYIELLNMVTNYEYFQTYFADNSISGEEKWNVSQETSDIMMKFLSAMQKLNLKFDEEYVQNRECYSLLRSFEFMRAVGFNPSVDTSVDSKLRQMNLK